MHKWISDHDPKNYSFERNSKIPHGSFKGRWMLTDRRVMWIVLALFIIGIVVSACG